MLRSIYSRIAIVNLIITFVVISVSTALLLGLLNNYLINDRSKMLSDEASRINDMTVFYINNRNTTVENLYYMSLNNESKRINGVIFIIDKSGNIITSQNADEHLDKSKLSTKLAQGVFEGEKIVSLGNFGGLFKTTYLTIGIPMVYDDYVVGATYLAMPTPEINRYKYQIFKIILSTITVAIILAMAVAYFYSKKISKPISDMSKAAKKVAGGNFDVRVNEKGKTEVDELAHNFNLMIDSLNNLEDMRSSFIANVSHELRTPMTTISGFVEGILDNTIPEESKEKYLRIVLDETKRLARLVSELLALARIDAGTLPLNIKEFDINELIRITILRFESQINIKHIDVNIDFEEENEKVLADKDSISRVLTNLFDNAIKFNFTNGYINVVVSSCAGGRVGVSVENSGIGIDKEELRHIWERFYKTDKSRSYDKKGMGLGLYLVHGILSAHGEKIWVESEKNKWARFTFTLKKSH